MPIEKLYVESHLVGSYACQIFIFAPLTLGFGLQEGFTGRDLFQFAPRSSSKRQRTDGDVGDGEEVVLA